MGIVIIVSTWLGGHRVAIMMAQWCAMGIIGVEGGFLHSLLSFVFVVACNLKYLQYNSCSLIFISN
jgi:hypothetical protein